MTLILSLFLSFCLSLSLRHGFSTTLFSQPQGRGDPSAAVAPEDLARNNCAKTFSKGLNEITYLLRRLRYRPFRDRWDGNYAAFERVPLYIESSCAWPPPTLFFGPFPRRRRTPSVLRYYIFAVRSTYMCFSPDSCYKLRRRALYNLHASLRIFRNDFFDISYNAFFFLRHLIGTSLKKIKTLWFVLPRNFDFAKRWQCTFRCVFTDNYAIRVLDRILSSYLHVLIVLNWFNAPTLP